MICPDCNEKVLFLIEGACKECVMASSKPVKAQTPIKAGSKRLKNPEYSKAALPDTTALQRECMEIMERENIKLVPFIISLGLKKSTMYRWWHNGTIVKFQRVLNHKIRKAIDEVYT